MPFADTYWDGKFLGKLATLSGVAEVAGEEGLQKLFIDEVRRRLEDWFLASKGEQSPLFYYNKTWGTLIGKRHFKLCSLLLKISSHLFFIRNPLGWKHR